MEAALNPAARLMVDDLLNFTLGVGEEDDDDETLRALSSPTSNSQVPDDNQSLSLPEEFAEEELEWLSNKDAFPAVETYLDILSDNPGIAPNHHSPVSVLELSATATAATTASNSSSTTSCCGVGSILAPLRYPVKARSKRRRRVFSELPSQQPLLWWSQANIKKDSNMEIRKAPPPPRSPATMGRRCQHCLAEKTPQWRAGPMGPKTLCNACGVRYKSGRLVPEYRPACSPTFSSSLHSNSHRKVMEMRRQKEVGEMMLVNNDACEYRLG